MKKWGQSKILFIRQSCAKVPHLPGTVAFDTAEAVMESDPQSVIHRISPRPLLMLAVERDQIVPNEETTEEHFNAAPSGLQPLPIPGSIPASPAPCRSHTQQDVGRLDIRIRMG